MGKTPTFHLHLDDSGSRSLNIKQRTQSPKDWFSIGGYLVREEDEQAIRDAHAHFCTAWNITYPLHSVEIRHRSDNFAWLKNLSDTELERFYAEIGDLCAQVPAIGIACVIDRPGYDARYRDKYSQRRWHLCKTAFTIVAERAAKYAAVHGRRLKIFVERSDRPSEKRIRNHFQTMRDEGMPFDQSNSAKYKPLTKAELAHTLWELRFKFKESRLTQIADLYLYPMARAGYEPEYRAFRHMWENNKIIDCFLDEDIIPHQGVKYSCFDFKNAKGEDFSSPLPASTGDLVGSAQAQTTQNT